MHVGHGVNTKRFELVLPPFWRGLTSRVLPLPERSKDRMTSTYTVHVNKAGCLTTDVVTVFFWFIVDVFLLAIVAAHSDDFTDAPVNWI